MKKFVLLFALTLLFSCLNISTDITGLSMVEPSIDNPEKPWSYGARSTTVIGLPFAPEPVQVTYDGAIYTRYAELAFFYGKEKSPVIMRQRNFKEGWMPIVQGSWVADGVEYSLELFSSAQNPDSSCLNTVQYAKFSAKNLSDSPKSVSFGGFARGSGGDYRLGGLKEPISAGDSFAFDNNIFSRNGKAIFTYSGEPSLEAVNGSTYNGQFSAGDFGVKDSTATGLVVYSKQLGAGQESSAFFKMERIPQPLDSNNTAQNLGVTADEFARHLAITEDYWKSLITSEVNFQIPEQRVNDTWKASMVHLLLATRTQNGVRRQGSGLPYDSLFLNDFVDMRMAYDVYGLPGMVKENFHWLVKNQLEDGMFIDVSLSHGSPILASHGQALYSLSHHFVITNGSDSAKQYLSLVKGGAEWIISEHRKNPNGLLRPSIPYDNEMIKGCYTSHNLWGLLGLRSAIRFARLIGEEDLAAKWEIAEKSYSKAVHDALDRTWEQKGYFAPGLDSYITGPAARAGFAHYRTDQEWENNMLFYPSEVLTKDDQRIFVTLEKIRKMKYREGIMTYRNGQHLHQYITLNQAHQYMAIGQQEQALMDLYSVLLHNGSTHEGFENLIEPWGNRTADPSCPPPHGWAAAKTALFIRNMMVREEGGSAGLDASGRGIVLFSLISPSWVDAGKVLAVENAVVEHGRLSATLKFREDGFTADLSGKFHTQPAWIAIPVPWFATVNEIKVDGKVVAPAGREIKFLPDTKRVEVTWSLDSSKMNSGFAKMLLNYRSEFTFVENPGDYETGKGRMEPFVTDEEKTMYLEPLSFELVKKAFVHEFNRRFQIHSQKGGRIVKVCPPRI
ncbi:MAG: hypothetical protein JXR63_04525 [Spirochaetales bacterium]|nr:hypothetical protein [Spirochaetales bacterium]